jgi:nitrite reductase/ring-hydroxylating ferredoxin subunit
LKWVDRFDDWFSHAALNGAGAGASPTEFRVSDVPPGSVLLLGNVAVFSAGGGYCATQAFCTHRGGPLSEGAFDDTTVTCPLHGAQFNIWTGAVLRGPAQDPLETYRVIIDGDVGRVDVG